MGANNLKSVACLCLVLHSWRAAYDQVEFREETLTVRSQVQQSLCVLPLYCCNVHGGLHPGSGGSPRRKHPLWLFHWGMCSRWFQLPLQQGLSEIFFFYVVNCSTLSRLISRILLLFFSTRGRHLTFRRWFPSVWPRTWFTPWGPWVPRVSSDRPVRSP